MLKPIQKKIQKRFYTLKVLLKNPQCGYCGSEQAEFVAFCAKCAFIYQCRPHQPVQYWQSSPLLAATNLSPKLKKALYSYKFYHQQQNLPLLRQLVIHYWRQYLLTQPQWHNQSVVVTNIPSRWSGNHWLPVAQAFSQAFGYDYQPQLLQWQRETTPQHKIDRRQARLSNLVNSMEVASPITQNNAPKNARYNAKLNTGDKPHTILVLDDMTTTGATFFEAFRAINDSELNPVSIIGLALAHVPLSKPPLTPTESFYNESHHD